MLPHVDVRSRGSSVIVRHALYQPNYKPVRHHCVVILCLVIGEGLGMGVSYRPREAFGTLEDSGTILIRRRATALFDMDWAGGNASNSRSPSSISPQPAPFGMS